MKVALASDHGGFNLKHFLKDYLLSEGYEVVDYGTDSLESCDYPDYVYPAAKAVIKKQVDFAIVICTTGIGASIVANKVRGVRCALVTNVCDAILTREHNNSNCLALGAKNVSNDLAKEIVDAYLHTEFAGGRHLRRIEKIKVIEEKEYE